VTPRLWCLREQVRHVIAAAPAPPAIWSSVLRRVVVVAGFFAVGLFTHDLATWVLCCLGAVQLGLIDVALPIRRLVSMLALTIVCITASVFVAMCLGGTWWSVPFIAALAYAYGVADRVGGSAAVASLGALALGVILAGEPRLPSQAAEAAGWVALGMLVQALAWLALARHERTMLVRRSVALKLRSVAALLRDGESSAGALAADHAETARMQSTIARAGLPPDRLLLIHRCAADAIAVSRAVTAWLQVRSPGSADRLTAASRLRLAARRLDETGALGTRDGESMPVLDDPWAISRAVATELARVDASVEGVLTGAAGPELPDPLGVSWVRVDQAGSTDPGRADAMVRMRSIPARYGFRMAAGVGIAEALSLAAPLAHSFWLPLTVVFTLKPDWSFTVVRGLTRTLGNLAAVLLLPTLMLAFGGSGWGLLAALVVLSSVTFRWFFGSYIWASFGLAGTVLVLDFALEPGIDLFAARIVATIIGALLSLTVALVMSGRASLEARARTRVVAQAFAAWAVDARASVAGPDIPAERLESGLMTARRALVDLEPVASAAAFELRPACDPVALTMVYASAARLDAALVAVTASSVLGMYRPGSTAASAERQALALGMLRLDQYSADFDRAVAELDS
jgi:hypothetical protein